MPIASLDQQFLETGLIQCPSCIAQNVLYNHEEVDISEEGNGLAAKLDEDSQVDLLLIVGTSLKTDGLFKLVKLMAQEVHAAGGAVIYVDKRNAGLKFSSFVDMHFQMDIDTWSSCMLSTIGSRSGASGCLQDRDTA
ncbi:hypothetical protein FRC10_008585 [Ceratobasidium sp. 414]|nr:hypothetical protein FRC10_008585 [Ceratobasidium sp. 414]